MLHLLSPAVLRRVPRGDDNRGDRAGRGPRTHTGVRVIHPVLAREWHVGRIRHFSILRRATPTGLTCRSGAEGVGFEPTRSVNP
jgi:hypothetical protein